MPYANPQVRPGPTSVQSRLSLSELKMPKVYKVCARLLGSWTSDFFHLPVSIFLHMYSFYCCLSPSSWSHRSSCIPGIYQDPNWVSSPWVSDVVQRCRRYLWTWATDMTYESSDCTSSVVLPIPFTFFYSLQRSIGMRLSRLSNNRSYLIPLSLAPNQIPIRWTEWKSTVMLFKPWTLNYYRMQH